MIHQLYAFSMLGPEMLVILFALLLLFGGRKIPELMRGIGKGIREFNTARNSIERELQEGMGELPKTRKKEKQKLQKSA